jgi:glucose-1-phosphatase
LTNHQFHNTMIKNIIFDFGGVLLDLDYHRTWTSFKHLSVFDMHKEHLPDWFVQLNDAFETGNIQQESFIWHVQKNASGHIPHAGEIVRAWNSMLLGWQPHKLNFLKSLRKEYKTYLLSNTNEIHIDWVQNDLKTNHDIYDFDSNYFEKTYYSHLIGLRKPDPAIFRYVLNTNGLIADETLFIDDSAEHIKAADDLGLKVHHFERNSDLIAQWQKILSNASHSG